MVNKKEILLETNRLYFREFGIEDAAILYEMHRDPAVTKYTGDPIPWDSVERVEQILKEGILPQYTKQIGRWAVFLKANDDFIGWCGLKDLDGEVDLGYRFIPKYWGTGYATEAAQAVLEYGKRNRIKNIIGRAAAENVASLKVLEKIGFQFLAFYDEQGVPSMKYICKESFE
jgi:ribosomal-protein-alanine N-acetyltransferase